MPTPFRHVALVGKYQAQGVQPVLKEIAQTLAARGIAVSVERETALNTGWTAHGAYTPEELAQRCDLAVVVGGDGTMLGIARELARHDLPLVGINEGRLGFITDIRATDWHDALVSILDGEYEEEARAMLDGEVWRGGEPIFQGFALNDVVVRSSSATMIELSITVGDHFVANLRADGLIVASPTGSTAYSLSAGGPILHPRIAGWVMVPVASHTLSNRPIVLPDDHEVRVEFVFGREEATANFDMQTFASLQRGDQVRMRRSPHQARFLHPRGWTYYATLRHKLHWHESGGS
jgi:NAD+ kinase